LPAALRFEIAPVAEEVALVDVLEIPGLTDSRRVHLVSTGEP